MSTFFTNVLKMVSGNVIAQIFVILLMPILTRLYSPGDFGVFQLFLSISTIITALSCLSYQFAIMLPKDDEDAANIVILCVILITIISIASGSIFILYSDVIGKVLNAPVISQYLIFLPFVVFFSSIFSVMTYWLSRRTQFGTIATAQVVNSVSLRVTQIGMGIYSISSFGLIAGLIVGYIASLVVLLRQIKDDISLFRAVKVKDIKILARRYKRFPIFTSWSYVAMTVSTQMVPLLLVFFFNPVIVGYYAIAYMVVFLPMVLIGNATLQVFFQKASEEKNQTGSLKNIFQETQQRLISIGMFPMFALIILGPDLFAFVLGSQWYVAGQYAGILAPWVLLNFVAAPLSCILYVLEKQTVDLTFNILILVSYIVVLSMGGIYGYPVVALILFSITGVIFWGWMYFYLLKISGIPYRIGLKAFSLFFCLGLVAAIPILVVKLLVMPVYVIFIIAGIVSFIYYAIVILYDPVLNNELRKALSGLKV